MGPKIEESIAAGNLHCMFCADPLAIMHGELYCAMGDCGYAAQVSAAIEAGLNTADTNVRKFVGEVEPYKYRCPVCTGPLTYPQFNMFCPQCKFTCKNMHFALTERHVHQRV